MEAYKNRNLNNLALQKGAAKSHIANHMLVRRHHVIKSTNRGREEVKLAPPRLSEELTVRSLVLVRLYCGFIVRVFSVFSEESSQEMRKILEYYMPNNSKTRLII